MQLLYIVRLDFENGFWGYVKANGNGKYSITSSPDEAEKFFTKTEAQDFYYDVIGSHAELDGVHIKKVYITTINY